MPKSRGIPAVKVMDCTYLESLYWGKSDGFGSSPQGGGLAKTLLTDGSLALIFSLGDNNNYARQFKDLVSHESK